MIEFLKHDDALLVTSDLIADWCEHLRHEKGLSARTVAQKYLAAAKLVFTVAVEKRRLRDNPAKDVMVRYTKKRRRGRAKGYTDDEARLVLSVALSGSGVDNWSDLNRRAVTWAPWICALTGARINEITQLRREDLLVEAGIPCIRITPDAGSVKTNQFRIVPLHPQLVELGLVDFIRQQKAGPLFFSLRPGAQPQTMAQNVGKKVVKWIREVVGITDRRVQPNHAWRHRFKTLARDVDMNPEYRDAIQGHEDGRSATDYGENTVKALYREICKLPRYDLSAIAAGR
ncbi:tyrosine-type recombinase/integrase [Pleomorphomonas carboxyditropha]|uniref:Tyr recombinase domain-containing protein n=1 Tax=Pleomorphomonas carboxyditropha TaxID=2023338 RepID=A0A2G9WQY1_9HYPH|nr:tyrosine-type recombinase/integrase [Pleomorphomonas carboxyditropha]PIO97055.1 hypothetical protein CJ014_22410 [Pleomorphomonas carboxyditropha]